VFKTVSNRYDNCCRHLSEDKVEENLSLEKPFVVRFKIEDRFPKFYDELYGNITHNIGSEGDPVLLKSDG